MIQKIHLSQAGRPGRSDGGGGESDSQSEGDVAVMEGRPRLKQPPKYAVLLLNDDYTTMEFVIEVLRRFFQKSGEDAMRIMLLVHRHGQGVAGVYTHEIAETKAYQVQEHARAHGFPLKCIVMEEAGEAE